MCKVESPESLAGLSQFVCAGLKGMRPLFVGE